MIDDITEGISNEFQVFAQKVDTFLDAILDSMSPEELCYFARIGFVYSHSLKQNDIDLED